VVYFHHTRKRRNIPTWIRTRTWSFGGPNAIRYTIGTSRFVAEPTTGFAPA
jgi:hypothetical protein